MDAGAVWYGNLLVLCSRVSSSQQGDSGCACGVGWRSECLCLCPRRQSAYQLLQPDSAGNWQLICRPLSTSLSPEGVVRIDPSYYSYEGCKCEDGYVARKSYTSDGRLQSLTCVVPEVG